MRKVVLESVTEINVRDIDPRHKIYIGIDSSKEIFRLRHYEGWNFYAEDCYYFGVKFAGTPLTVQEAIENMMQYGDVFEFNNYEEYCKWYVVHR